jgi:hypothetical protein
VYQSTKVTLPVSFLPIQLMTPNLSKRISQGRNRLTDSIPKGDTVVNVVLEHNGKIFRFFLLQIVLCLMVKSESLVLN